MSLLVRDVMTKDVHSVAPEMSLAELERCLLEKHIGGAPVIADNKLVGVVSRSDIVKQVSVGRALAGVVLADYYRDISGFAADPPSDPSAQEAALSEQIIGERLVDFHVAEAMTTTIIAVNPDTPIKEVAQLMLDDEVHRVLVTEQDELLGIVSSFDLVRVIANSEN